MYKIHVTKANGVEVNVETADEPTAQSFFDAFCINPTVTEVTISVMGKTNWLFLSAMTRQATTLPL